MDNEISLQQIYDKLVSFDTRLKNLENPPNRSSYAMNYRNYAQVVSDNCNATRTFYNKNPNLGINYKQYQPQNRMPNNKKGHQLPCRLASANCATLWCTCVFVRTEIRFLIN